MNGRIGPRGLLAARARARLLAAASLAALALCRTPAGSAEEGPGAMIRRVLSGPQAAARVVIERSDPFGGPPSRERGRIWFLPGHGLRYRSEERGGQDLVIDRKREVFLLYSPLEEVLYRGRYDRAPLRLRRLIAEPERLTASDLRAAPERRAVRGAVRDGYRVRSEALGGAPGDVAVWISGDARSGLPKFLSLETDVDTLLVEFREWTLRDRPRPSDLEPSVPRGTREEPLDPRELLERAGERGGPGGSR